MWRAFVYSATSIRIGSSGRTWSSRRSMALPGQRDRPGEKRPLDFQPREPFSPLFGAMPRTPLMAELQITQEYLGQSTHLVYLAPMWKNSSTPTRMRRVPLDRREGGRRHASRLPPLRHGGVANTGRDPTGRVTSSRRQTGTRTGAGLESGLTAEAIADEWIAMTWGHDAGVTATIRSLMLALARPTSTTRCRWPAPSDRRRSLRADARERRPAPCRLVRHLLPPGGWHRHRFDRTARGSNAVGQYGRRCAASGRPGHVSRAVPALVHGCHGTTASRRVRRSGRRWCGTTAGAPARRVDGDDVGLAPRRVDDERHRAVLAKLRCRPRTPRPGATSAWPISGSSAGGRGEEPRRDGHG